MGAPKTSAHSVITTTKQNLSFRQYAFQKSIEIISPRMISHMVRDCIFLTAFSIAGTFFLRAAHCSSVKAIPEDTTIEVKNSKDYDTKNINTNT